MALENMLALSNGLGSNSATGGMASDYLTQLLQQNTQKKDSYWNSPWVAMAAGLLKGNDENGIPMSTGQALGQGLQNIIAMKQKQAQTDADNLKSMVWLQSSLGASGNKLVPITDKTTGNTVQIPYKDAVGMIQGDPGRYEWGKEPKASNLQYHPVQMTGADARKKSGGLYKGSDAQVEVPAVFDPTTGEVKYDWSNAVAQNKKDANDTSSKPPTGTDLMRSRSVARDLLGWPKTGAFTQLPVNSKEAQQVEAVVNKARELHKNNGYEGNVTDYMQEAYDSMATEWSGQGLNYGYGSGKGKGASTVKKWNGQ